MKGEVLEDHWCIKKNYWNFKIIIFIDFEKISINIHYDIDLIRIIIINCV